MSKGVLDFRSRPGFIRTTDDNGIEYDWPLADMLRASDIPTGLTYVQVASLSALANLVVILIRTLIDRKVLTDSFLENEEINLDDIIETIEAMGGSYQEPALENE